MIVFSYLGPNIPRSNSWSNRSTNFVPSTNRRTAAAPPIKKQSTWQRSIWNRISHSSPVKFLKQQVHRLCTIHSSQNCCRPRHSRTVNFPTFNIEQAFYNIKKRANTVELLSHGCWYKNGRNHCCSVAAVVNTCASFGGKNDLISLLLSPSFKSINIRNAGNIIIYFEPAISRQI